MPTHRDDRTDGPSVVDLVTNPEKFDQWQRQREREEEKDGSRNDDGGQHRQKPNEPWDRPSE